MNTRSFQQILEEKLNSQQVKMTKTEPSSMANSFCVSPKGRATLDPAHLAFLLGTIPRAYCSGQPSGAHQKYARPPRKPHLLNEMQREAFHYFEAQQTSLPADFSCAQLKNAYRSLAHRFHPDKKGGSQASFLILKFHYDCLKGLFRV